jgi:hypothetical protein
MKPIRLIQCLILTLALVKAFGFFTEAHAEEPNSSFRLYLPSSLNASSHSVPPPPPPADETLPAEIVTTWYTGVPPMVDFYDPKTGEWGDSGGLGEMYQFSAKGDFIYAGFLRLQNGQCVSEVSTYREGKAKATADQLTLTPSLAKTRSVVRCGSNSESTSDGPFDALTIGYMVKEEANGLIQLTLTDKGQSTSFYRQGMVQSLVGAWKLGDVRSEGFYDAATKSFAPQSGPGTWYRFKADGTYTFGEYGFGTDQAGCALTGWVYLEGKVSISGGKLTTTPTSGAARVDNACNPGAPKVTAYTEAERSYTWFYRDRITDQKLVIIPLEHFQEFIFRPE